MNNTSPARSNIFSIVAIIAMAIVNNSGNKAQEFDLRILWANVTYGYLGPLYHREEGDDQFIDRAMKADYVGGMAYIAMAANRQRNELPDKTLFLDGSDTWNGTIFPVC